MGRHSAPAGAEPEPAEAEPRAVEPSSGTTPPPSHALLDRAALALAAAGGTGAVMAWAGADPLAYLLGAAGTGVVVLVAAQLAGAMPGPAHHRGDRRRDREP